MKRLATAATLSALALATPLLHAAEPKNHTADVCVYGATPAGIVAAVTAKQEGLTVVLVEPSRWVGGILGAGIKPMQDCP
ncbi:MAG TPA: FAD-dependent oxidoreductase, partial [Candidatus Saccharimonadia bacterium]|nr:FAD-dependent oxidoreductase [Candidatus Saccharimonadia bacterium]